jgi:hypothetical protein
MMCCSGVKMGVVSMVTTLVGVFFSLLEWGEPRMTADECGAVGGIITDRVNLPQCHYAHHKSHMTCPGLEPGPPRWKSAINRLSNGMA